MRYLCRTLVLTVTGARVILGGMILGGRPSARSGILWSLLLIAARSGWGQPTATVIDFEGLADGVAIATQYPGMTYSSAVAVKSGISLNEAECPPRSGTNALADAGGPVTVVFSSPATAAGGYFTYRT